MALQWHSKSFAELTTQQLYRILQAREQVFVVEQQCPYLDCDNKDLKSFHLWVEEGSQIAAYCRLVAPGVSYTEPSIGRVITTEKFRGTGLGRTLMERAIATIEDHYPGQGIRISAQAYLKQFYSSLGFKTVSGPYMEDNIPHNEMLRSK